MCWKALGAGDPGCPSCKFRKGRLLRSVCFATASTQTGLQFYQRLLPGSSPIKIPHNGTLPASSQILIFFISEQGRNWSTQNEQVMPKILTAQSKENSPGFADTAINFFKSKSVNLSDYFWSQDFLSFLLFHFRGSFLPPVGFMAFWTNPYFP